LSAEQGKQQSAVKGFTYYTAYTLLLAGNNYVQLFLFKETVGVSTFQLTFIRGILCALLVVLMLLAKGHSIKGRLVDPVDRTTFKPLIMRAF